MIHTLLTLTRPLFVLDCEATGLNTDTARIVELAFEQWTDVGRIREWSTRLHPGIPIPASATAVHGITDADVVGRPRFHQIAANLAKGFTECDFAGKHVRFDLQLIAAEMERAHVTWSYVGARILDIDRLEALANPRDLSTLHAKYVGLPHDGAHGALSDVRASTTVLCKQLERYDLLPRDLGALHERSWPGWLTADGKFRLVGDVPTIMFGKHRDLPMCEVPLDYWDWILSKDFPPDVKRLAAEAKLGRYPSSDLPHRPAERA